MQRSYEYQREMRRNQGCEEIRYNEREDAMSIDAIDNGAISNVRKKKTHTK